MIRKILLSCSVIALALQGLCHGAITIKKADGTSLSGELQVVDARGVILSVKGKPLVVAQKDLSSADQALLQSWQQGKAVPPGFEKPIVAETIKMQSGNLAYDTSEIEAAPGVSVVITLTNEDELQHNLIVCAKPGEAAGQDLAFSALLLGGDGMEKEWVPESDDVFAASRMVNPHETTMLYFHAPAQAESFAYVCTFPGHSQVMKGLLIVGGGAEKPAPAAGGVASKDAPGLHDVRYQLYKGNWKALPDWSKLSPAKEGRVKGLCDMKKYGEKDQFGLVFTGTFVAAKEGSYTFSIASDDGSRISINGKAVAGKDGIHPVTADSGKVKLSAGAHAFKMEYFEGGGQEDLFASWKGPGDKKEIALTPGTVKGGGKKGNNLVGIPLFPPKGEAMIYRNFIDGVGGARGIGVGYSEGVHLAFDAENGRIAMVWRGGFIDAKRHWTGRGQGYQPPAGPVIKADPQGQMLATLASPADEWPKADYVGKGKSKMYSGPDHMPSAYQFKGYELNAKRQPTFYWSWGDVEVSDFPVPNAEGGFTRTLNFTGKAPADPLYFRKADGDLKPIDLSSGQAQLVVHYTID